MFSIRYDIGHTAYTKKLKAEHIQMKFHSGFPKSRVLNASAKGSTGINNLPVVPEEDCLNCSLLKILFAARRSRIMFLKFGFIRTSVQ